MDLAKNMGEEVLKSLDADTLASLAETAREMAGDDAQRDQPQGGDATRQMAERFQQMDPETQLKLMEVARRLAEKTPPGGGDEAGRRPDPSAQPDVDASEMQSRLESLDPRVRRALEETARDMAERSGQAQRVQQGGQTQGGQTQGGQAQGGQAQGGRARRESDSAPEGIGSATGGTAVRRPGAPGEPARPLGADGGEGGAVAPGPDGSTPGTQRRPGRPDVTVGERTPGADGQPGQPSRDGQPGPDATPEGATPGEPGPDGAPRPLEPGARLVPDDAPPGVPGVDGPAAADRPGGGRRRLTLTPGDPAVSAGERPRVPFEQALEATQQDALRALGRQRVPEAYERIVREYFDRARTEPVPPGR